SSDLELIINELQKVDLSQYQDTQTWSEFIDSIEGLSKVTRDYLKNTELGTDIITQNSKAVEEAKEHTVEKAKADQELILISDELKGKLIDLNSTFKIAKDNMDDENARHQWILSVSSGLDVLKDKLEIVQDESGNLKFQMQDGSKNPFIDKLNQQIADLGYNIELTRDDLGNLKVELSDGSGKNESIHNAQEDINGLGIKVDTVKDKIKDLSESDVDIVINDNAHRIISNMDTLGTSVDDLNTTTKDLKKSLEN